MWRQSYLWLVFAILEVALLISLLFWTLTLPESVVGRSNCLAPNGKSDICYCEAFAKHGPFKEFYNTISALAFSLSGLIIAFFLGYSSQPKPINRMTSTISFPLSYTALAVFLGPGSMMFHAALTALGGFFDTFSMYMWLGWIVAYDIIRIFNIRKNQNLALAMLYAVVVTCFTLAQQWMTKYHDGGNQVFAALVVLAFICEGAVFFVNRGYNEWAAWRWFIAAVTCFFAALAIWNLSQTGGPLCFPNSWLQGHAVWHVMSAVTVGLLYRYYVVAPDPTPQALASLSSPF